VREGGFVVIGSGEVGTGVVDKPCKKRLRVA